MPLGSDASLRVLVSGDAEAIGAIIADNPEIRQYVGWIKGLETVQDIRDRLELFQEKKALRYGVVKEGKLVGYVGMFRFPDNKFDGEYDLGYFLDKEARGEGLVTRGVEALISEAESHLDPSPLSFALYIEDGNTESLAVADRTHFEASDFTAPNDLGVEERRYVRMAGHGQTAAS